MARKKRRRRQREAPSRPLNLRGIAVTEVGPGGLPYQVQRVGPAQKPYVCPGCLQEVRIGTEHVVAWPEEAPFGQPSGVEGRRHWHSDCWRRKLRPV